MSEGRSNRLMHLIFEWRPRMRKNITGRRICEMVKRNMIELTYDRVDTHGIAQPCIYMTFDRVACVKYFDASVYKNILNSLRSKESFAVKITKILWRVDMISPYATSQSATSQPTESHSCDSGKTPPVIHRRRIARVSCVEGDDDDSEHTEASSRPVKIAKTSDELNTRTPSLRFEPIHLPLMQKTDMPKPYIVFAENRFIQSVMTHETIHMAQMKHYIAAGFSINPPMSEVNGVSYHGRYCDCTTCYEK